MARKNGSAAMVLSAVQEVKAQAGTDSPRLAVPVYVWNAFVITLNLGNECLVTQPPPTNHFQRVGYIDGIEIYVLDVE